ncbi:DUF362 domain-containing protein [Candidatus Latescibacterota bacterium]
MPSRRDFLLTGAALISALPVFHGNTFASRYDIDRSKERRDPGMKLVRDGIEYAKKGRKQNIPPVLREEILDNPQAVFVIRTNITSQKHDDGKLPAEIEKIMLEGYYTARKIFRKGSNTGGTTYIKPNFVGGFNADMRSLNNGISTHPSFVSGFCDALKEMGNRNIVVGANGAATHDNFVESGICDMLDSHGVCFTEGKYESWSDYKKSEVTWIKNPDGVVMKKIPFLKLTKEKDTTLINIAKDRIHQLGFTTLTIKNLQGIMPVGYMHICGGWPSTLNRGNVKRVFNPDYRKEIEQLYIKHANMGYKYWDEGEYSRAYFNAGGWEAYMRKEFEPDYKTFWGEQWGQRMIDIASNINPSVNIVEGIVGIDGRNDLHLNNFITISKSMIACDSVASWLMGQDPRELPYLRIANERGMGENDIEKIKIFEIIEQDIMHVNDYRKLPRSKMGVNVYSESKELRFF